MNTNPNPHAEPAASHWIEDSHGWRFTFYGPEPEGKARVVLTDDQGRARYASPEAPSYEIAREMAEAFAAGARESLDDEGVSFGDALELLHEQARVARRGWNGKGMWIALQSPTELSKMTLPYIYMHTAKGELVPWLASQTDLLATDWIVIS
jgi:hypothetical protein